jgi:hypothetical protein
MWGINVISPINPKTSNEHRFILAAMDCFTKWTETTFYAHVTLMVVCKIIEKNIVCYYSLLEVIVTIMHIFLMPR